MKRREVIALLGGAAAVWPLAARAQQQAAMPVVGFLGPTTAAVFRQWTEVFVQRLRELGWSEGRTITIEYRWAEARNERFAEIAEEFIRRKVDVIFTTGNAIPAAKQATSVVPIVFVLASDPVGSGFVASLARPGGNITGVSSQSTDTVGKRLELLREIVPSLRRLAILGNVRDPGAALEMREAHDSARASAWKLPHWKSGEPTTSSLPSRR
jgi:putative tryptophan/tyrosine transport system substrate-binding protein